MKQYLSFDFGGTFIKYALINENADVTFEYKIQTPRSLDELLLFVEQTTDWYRKNTNIEGIGISCPGTITKNGEIQGTSAIPYLYSLPLRRLLEDATGETVTIENDANAAALAELWKGAAKGYKDVLTIVIGTGIGGAIISDGKLYRGAHLYGGEFGYSILYADPTSKEIGYWSKMASTGSLIRKVAKERNMGSDELSGEEIFKQASMGDEVCKKAVEEFYFMLAAGIHNLQHIYDPEIILIGGGISARSEFITELSTSITKVQASMDLNSLTPRIDTCYFMNQANLIGAIYPFIRS